MRMPCFLSKIERKILSDIAKAKPRDERGRFVKRHKLPKNNTHTHRKITFDKVFISLLLVAGLVLFALLLQGCTPRNATMCLKQGDWVKCPKGVKVGTELK